MNAQDLLDNGMSKDDFKEYRKRLRRDKAKTKKIDVKGLKVIHLGDVSYTKEDIMKLEEDFCKKEQEVFALKVLIKEFKQAILRNED